MAKILKSASENDTNRLLKRHYVASGGKGAVERRHSVEIFL